MKAGRDAQRAARLWRWAARRLDGEVFQPHPEVHEDVAAFIDAVNAASRVLKVLFPVARGVARMRYMLRGIEIPPHVGSEAHALSNWNSATGFLEGADFAHRAVLGTLWRPQNSAFPVDLREAFSPQVRQWLEAERQLSCPSDGKAHDGEAVTEAIAHLVSSSVRFEGFGGPQSLEVLRKMDVSSLRTLTTDEERLGAFQHDTFRGSKLDLKVVAVAEADLLPTTMAASEGPRTLRRADRLLLTCDFNLREGIASPFRVETLQELLAEVKLGGFRDDE